MDGPTFSSSSSMYQQWDISISIYLLQFHPLATLSTKTCVRGFDVISKLDFMKYNVERSYSESTVKLIIFPIYNHKVTKLIIVTFNKTNGVRFHLSS
jgi:hypothetical protein